jgi:endonuclease/exonuclease/phosphatase family metal-dependent hydrolase
LCGTVVANDQTYAPYFVGALHEKWKFPSDHLPIGATLPTFRIVSWNILNEAYLRYIIEDGQGLNKSLITRLAHVRSRSGLSKREWVVYQECQEMMEGGHERSLVGLLETSVPLLRYLKHHLPSGWRCLAPHTPFTEDVFLYNSRRLRVLDSTVVPYGDNTTKVVFLLKVQERKSDKKYSIILTHVPGGGPQGRTEMAHIVHSLFDPSIETVLMGDMNASPNDIAAALQQEGLPFTIAATTYPTHVNTLKQASWIDSFFVYSPSGKKFLHPDPSRNLFAKMKVHLHGKKTTVFGVRDAAQLLEELKLSS